MKSIEKDIVNYLNGELSKVQLDKLEFWLKKAENRKLFDEYVKANHLLDLKLKNFESDKGFSLFIEKISNPKVIKLNFKRLYKYAALLLVAIGVAYAVLNETESNKFAQIYVPKGETGEVVLPDGTKVQLNSNTTLRYPLTFSNNIRKVSLEGEAFFDVVKRKEQPFVVNLPSNMDIKVLGTSFNIKAYLEDSNTITTLFTGKIELLYKEEEYVKNILLPGDRAVFQKSKNKMSFTKIKDFEEVVAWKNELLVFKKENLNDIVNELNRFYDAEISINDEKLKTKVFTASFKRGITIDEILEFLVVAGNFKCEKSLTKENEFILTNN